MRRSAVLFGLALAACSGLPPLRHKFEVGRDSYVILVADAPDGRGDLWAMSPEGSDIVQITFSLPAEWWPRLSPSGDVIAFLRSREQGDTARTRIWLMNLLNGSERELILPDSAGAPTALTWTEGGRALLVRTTRTMFRANAPPHPAEPTELSATERAAAAQRIRREGGIAGLRAGRGVRGHKRHLCVSRFGAPCEHCRGRDRSGAMG